MKYNKVTSVSTLSVFINKATVLGSGEQLVICMYGGVTLPHCGVPACVDISLLPFTGTFIFISIYDIINIFE